MNFLLALPLAWLAAASALHTWKSSGLPIHVVQLLRALGWRKTDREFWEGTCGVDLLLWTRQDFSDWLAGVFADLRQPWTGLLAEGCDCPVCQSWHVCLWVAGLLWALHEVSGRQALLLWLTGPWPSLYLVRALDRPKNK